MTDDDDTVRNGTPPIPVPGGSPCAATANLSHRQRGQVFAERWTPLILRELPYGSHHFGDFCGASP